MILLDKALEYANGIVNGEIIANQKVIKQCKIFLEDYNKRQYDEDFPYCFDEEKLKVINNLLKLFNFSKGIKEGKSLKGKPILPELCGYQALLISAIFGWRFKKNKDLFRYRDVVLYIARKNSKTYTVAYIFILLLLTEADYSEFYSICVSKKLAAEVKKAIAQTIECSPALTKHFKVSKNDLGKITCLLTKSFYEPRTARANANNAINPSAFVSDEHAGFTDNSNYQAMKSGQRVILNPISIICTTGYPESNSIMLSELKYIDMLFNGEVKNDRYFALCYYAEDEYLWDDIGIEQANPLHIEETYQEIRERREKALVIEQEKTEYLTKDMNILIDTVRETENYLSMDIFRQYSKPKDKIYAKYKGQKVSIGIDLSKTIDLTSVSIMTRADDGKIYCSSMGFIPSGTLKNPNRQEKIDYRKEQRDGNVKIISGNTIKILEICDYIRSIEKEYDCKIECIYYDGTFAELLKQELENEYDSVEVSQTYTVMSSYYKMFRNELYDGNIYYAENNLLDYCASCSQESVGKVGDILVCKNRKNKSERIDLLITLPFAYRHWYIEKKEETYDALEALRKMSEDW